MRVDIISLILRKDDVTVVRDAVVLVPPTALLLYLEILKKAISKIDDFLSNFSCKTIQNRKNYCSKGLFWLEFTSFVQNVVHRVVENEKDDFIFLEAVSVDCGQRLAA